jgi:hypothetical protein
MAMEPIEKPILNSLGEELRMRALEQSASGVS